LDRIIPHHFSRYSFSNQQQHQKINLSQSELACLANALFGNVIPAKRPSLKGFSYPEKVHIETLFCKFLLIIGFHKTATRIRKNSRRNYYRACNTRYIILKNKF